MYENLMPKGADKEIFEKILEAWREGLSDREACFHASPDMKFTIKELREWYAEEPRLFDLRDGLKGGRLTKARRVVNKAIDEGNEKTARWFLEKKAPEEFGTKAQISIDAPIEVSVVDKEAEMRAFMEQFGEE